MSSIVLKKDHDGKKSGEVISVPFPVGKLLIADGTGVYLDSDEGRSSLAKSRPQARTPGGEVKASESKATESAEPLKPAFPPEPQPGGHEKQNKK